MKPRRDLSAILAVAVFSLAAIACAALVFSGGAHQLAAIAGAIFFLAAGLTVSVIILWSKDERLGSRFEDQDSDIDNLAAEIETAGERLLQVEQRLAKTANVRFDEIIADVRALREDLQGFLNGKAAQPVAAADQEPAQIPKETAPPPPTAAERLELLLEPVIELMTGATSHYRALLNLTDDRGNTVLHRDLMDRADRGGMRTTLDIYMVRQVMPVIRRLRLRHPGLRIFVPAGVSTLSIPDEFARLVAALEEDKDAAASIVFELGHDDLGHLNEEGIGNLARLARLGVTMSLSRVSIAALDLAALRQLGVRYLVIGVVAFDPNVASQQSVLQFVQYARAMQFQLIASNVETQQQSSSAARSARFGYGPYFAPPRKVKPDAGIAQAAWKAQAA